MKPTFQDLPFSSSTPCWPLLRPSPFSPPLAHSAVSPFHPLYTVSPILINFTNPDGKSGLWQAGCHHRGIYEITAERDRIFIPPLLPPILYAARRDRGGGLDRGGRERLRERLVQTRHNVSLVLCLTGRNSRLSSYTASNQRLPDRIPRLYKCKLVLSRYIRMLVEI